MFPVLSFDEVNSLLPKRRSIPFDLYFGEMGIPAEDRRRRIRLANRFYEELLAVFLLMFDMAQSGAINYEVIREETFEAYMRAMEGTIPESDLIDRAETYAEDFVRTTQEHEGEPYYFSEDRLTFNSANEAEAMQNAVDYFDAFESDKKFKTWHTMEDEAVRETHADLDGATLPIDSLFYVGDSVMRYPKDLEYNPSAHETVNCRCWITYI